MTKVPLNQADAADVIEMAVEPSYISEIARKLRAADGRWNGMSHKTAVGKVSRVVRALEENKRVASDYIDYSSTKGQRFGSLKQTMAGVQAEWEGYKIVHSFDTDIDVVREGFKDYVDTEINTQDKVNIIKDISGYGKKVSEMSEGLLEDVAKDFYGEENVVSSSYTDPSIDTFVEMEDGSVAYEISTRSVNPIGVGYANQKLQTAIDKGEEIGSTFDVVLMAPEFTGTVEHRYGDSDIIHIYELPIGNSGTPVIDFDSIDVEDFQRLLEKVYRDYTYISLQSYRGQIERAVNMYES